MPGAFRSYAGMASFVDGWLDQDREQQEQQLELLESLAGTTAIAQNVRGAQATMRREEALFPGQLQQQGLTTQQMGLTTQEMQRTDEEQARLDAYVSQRFGVDSYDLYTKIVDLGGEELLRRKESEMLLLNAPVIEAQGAVLPMQQEFARLQAFGEGGGPATTGYAQAIGAEAGLAQSEFQRELAQRTARGPLARVTAASQVGLERLKVPQAQANVGLTQANAGLARRRRFEGPAGEQERLLESLIAHHGEVEGTKRFYETIILGHNIKIGRTPEITDIQRGLQDIEMAIFELEDEGTTDRMAVVLMDRIMGSSPAMFGSTDPEQNKGKSKEELREILKPLFNYWNTVHTEVDPQGRSYTEISLAPVRPGRSSAIGGIPGPGEATEGEVSRTDIDTVMTELIEAGTIQPFSAPAKTQAASKYLENLMKNYKPREWEAVHHTHKGRFLQRGMNEAEWESTLWIIRAMHNVDARGIR